MVPLVMKEELNIVEKVLGMYYVRSIPLVKQQLLLPADNWDLCQIAVRTYLHAYLLVHIIFSQL